MLLYPVEKFEYLLLLPPVITEEGAGDWAGGEILSYTISGVPPITRTVALHPSTLYLTFAELNNKCFCLFCPF